MNRKQFFKFFGPFMHDEIEREYFDNCWNLFEKYQTTTHKDDFPFNIDAPREVHNAYYKMWNRAIRLHSTRNNKKGGK